MLCKKPFQIGVMSAGCGQCLPCRINRRRLWTHRMLLESFMHSESSFVTLTYDNEHLPSDNSLNPKDMTLFLKRLRKEIHPKKLRYYLVGEYGDQTQRPHYHMALYGVGRMFSDTIKTIWGKGLVHCGDLNNNSAGYVAGYITKKMTKADDPRLNGRHPEFARMSRKPGIGATAMDILAQELQTNAGKILLDEQQDVPSVLQHGVKKLPLGRYLRRKLREKIGKDQDTPSVCLQNYGFKLRFMFEEDLKNPENKNLTLGAIVIKNNKQRLTNEEVKYKIYSSRRTI